MCLVLLLVTSCGKVPVLENGQEAVVTSKAGDISVDDLYEIADILAGGGVENIAVQKYIPHFEDEDNKTTDTMRNQFFNDYDLRDKLNSMFESVTWRE